MAPLLQRRLPWGVGHHSFATLPMALLTAIVRKEAMLPDMAAFAAAQLLPVIQAATEEHLAATPGRHFSPNLCKELLVSAHLPPCIAAAGMRQAKLCNH